MAGRFDALSTSKPPPAGRFDEASVATEEELDETPFLGFLNRGIAGGLGGPVDLVNAGLGLMGLGSDEPFGGSKSIEAGMEAIGVGLPEEGQRANTLGQRIERGLGETAGAVLPFGAVASGVARGTGLVGQAAAKLTEGVAKAPITATVLDAASGAGSGGGAHLGAELFPDSDTAEALGALAGGLLPAGAALGGAGARALVTKGPTGRAAQFLARPFTKPGGRTRAERRARSLVADPKKAAQESTQETIADLSPAQKSGEKGLMALEREVLAQDLPLESEFARRTAAAADDLRAQVENVGRGSVNDTRSFIERRMERLINASKLRAQQAAASAEERIAKIKPERRPVESSVIVRDEIEKAYKSGRAQERELYGDVNPGTKVPTSSAAKAYDDLLGDLSQAQRDDMPSIARKFLGKGGKKGKRLFKSEETVKEMQGLYSKLREDARAARSENKFNKARLSNGIADAILKDMDASDAVDDAFDIARAYSRDLNDRFTRGPVGRILGTDKTGAAGVDPQLTLQTSVGKSGDAGGVQAEAILRAAPSAQSEVGQFIVGELMEKATRNGKFNPQAARELIRKSNSLAQFPELERDILAAVDAAEGAARAAKQPARAAKALAASQNKKFMDAQFGNEINQVLRAHNPRAAARELRQQARKDPGAVAGLRSGAIEYLIKRAGSGAADETGRKVLSGNGMAAVLNDKTTMGALSEFLSKPEISRIKRIASELSKIEASKGDLPNIKGIMNDVPSSILDLAARTVGARGGSTVSRATGGGGIAIPAAFSRAARNLLGRLTNNKAQQLLIEAIKDRSGKLSSSLLMETLTPAKRKIAARRFNAWLAGPGKRFAESLEEEDEGTPASGALRFDIGRSSQDLTEEELRNTQ